MKKFEILIGKRKLIFETGRIAKQADGSVVVQYGDTVVLVAVCGARQPKEGTDFFPLTVDYSEKSYAGGRIPGGYFRREGKASEKEILTSRLIDRPIRPLFPEGFYHEVQVTASVLSSDKENNSDILAMNATSAALMISGVPFLGPMAAARVGEINGEFILNPTFKELEKSSLDIVVATTDLGIIMIEAGANMVSEKRIVEALEFATESLKPLLKLQKEMRQACGKPEIPAVLTLIGQDLMAKVSKIAAGGIDQINHNKKTKESREEALKELSNKVCCELVVEGSSFTEDQDRKSTRLNSSHSAKSRMPSSA